VNPPDAGAATLALLASRADGATICPSEVARAIAAEAGHADWRGEMGAVHAAVDGLAAQGLVRLSWKGRAMAVRGGPYRIGRGCLESSQVARGPKSFSP
jgi:hypothetical protein